MGQAAYVKKVQVSSDGTTYYDVPATSSSLNAGGDLLDDTNLANNAGYRSRIYGLNDWSVDITADYDGADQAIQVLRTAKLNKTKVYVKYLPDGSTGFSGQGLVEKFNLSGEVGGKEEVSITIQGDDALSAV